MAKNLSRIIGYKQIKPHTFRTIDIGKLKLYPVKSKDDWSEQCYTSLKRYFRYQQYLSQERRCAYCRRILNPLGLNEHIDHLVARSIKSGWMFKPRNLVLTCYQCNTQKSVFKVLNKNNPKRLPRRSRNYVSFNPYVHNWSNHFEIEDSLFLKSKSRIGTNTIEGFKLYDYKYSMVYAEEANIFGNTAIKRAAIRLVRYHPGSNEYKSAQKLIKEISRHI